MYLVYADENKRLDIFMTDDRGLSSEFEETNFIDQQLGILSTVVIGQKKLVKEYFDGKGTLENLIIFNDGASKIINGVTEKTNRYIKIQREQGFQSSDAMNNFLTRVNSVAEANEQVVLQMLNIAKEEDKKRGKKSWLVKHLSRALSKIKKQKPPSPVN